MECKPQYEDPLDNHEIVIYTPTQGKALGVIVKELPGDADFSKADVQRIATGNLFANAKREHPLVDRKRLRKECRKLAKALVRSQKAAKLQEKEQRASEQA